MVICLLVQLPWQHKAPIDDLWRKQRILIGRAHLVLVYLALYLSREIIETLLLSLIVTVSHFRMPALHIKSCHNEYFGIMLKCPIYILHCLILEAPSRIAAYNTHFCFSDKIRLTFHVKCLPAFHVKCLPSTQVTWQALFIWSSG